MKTTKLEQSIVSRFGVSAIECDALTVEWAAEFLAKYEGNIVVAKQWKRLNNKRARLGKHVAYPAYESGMFHAYFSQS